MDTSASSTDTTSGRAGAGPDPMFRSRSRTSTGPSSDPVQPALPPSKITHRAIRLGDWEVHASHGPIGSARELDTLEDRLGIPLPEMVFPHNRLVLTHIPSARKYVFDAEHALASVAGARGDEYAYLAKPVNPSARRDQLLKVSHANAWGQGRCVFVTT